MRRSLPAIVLAIAAFLVPLSTAPRAGENHAGKPLVIELDNAFIKKYANRATITSEFTITGVSAPHPAKNDGEVHIGGWCEAAGLPGVSEVMNVKTSGKKAMDAFRNAVGKKVNVTGAWRLWGEHPGLGAQIQAAPGPNPDFNPDVKSNPGHVFEIHPVAAAKIDEVMLDTTATIGATIGFTPHEASKAFVLGYERMPCKIVPLPNNRTKLITESLGFNFTEFVIRLDKAVVKLDDGGHAARCSVFDTDGELLLRDRRMVFIKGTKADDAVKDLEPGKTLQVIGMPRIDLALVQWRVEHKGDTAFDVSPLDWRLPYEMIIVAAKPYTGELD